MEAGLGWITKFTKDFTNSAALKVEKEAGVKNKLVGFELIDRGIPRHDCPVVNAEGKQVGKVTSGTMSPSLQKPIGMAYVPKEQSAPGTEILVDVRGKVLKGVVVKTPFIQSGK